MSTAEWFVVRRDQDKRIEMIYGPYPHDVAVDFAEGMQSAFIRQQEEKHDFMVDAWVRGMVDGAEVDESAIQLEASRSQIVYSVHRRDESSKFVSV